jgi:hypothetical protein
MTNVMQLFELTGLLSSVDFVQIMGNEILYNSNGAGWISIFSPSFKTDLLNMYYSSSAIKISESSGSAFTPIYQPELVAYIESNLIQLYMQGFR